MTNDSDNAFNSKNHFVEVNWVYGCSEPNYLWSIRYHLHSPEHHFCVWLEILLGNPRTKTQKVRVEHQNSRVYRTRLLHLWRDSSYPPPPLRRGNVRHDSLHLQWELHNRLRQEYLVGGEASAFDLVNQSECGLRKEWSI